MVPEHPDPGARLTDYLTFGLALVTITNPLGAMAIFTGLVADHDEREKRATALQASLAVAIILLIVTWAGSMALALFGVTPAGLQAGGGLILILMGISMLGSSTPRTKSTKREKAAAMEKESIAVVPLAIPITIGPGAITTVMLATQAMPGLMDRVVISLISLLLSAIVWVCLYYATPMARLIGETGIGVVTRLMGLFITAVAFQMMANGLTALLPGLAG